MTDAHDTAPPSAVANAAAAPRSRMAGHALVEALLAQGVDTCFGVPGESYLAVLDALQDVIGDDTNVARLVVEKSYGQEARTTVRIS